MRIVAIVEKSYRGLTAQGGAETMTADMLEYLVQLGWDAEVLICHGTDYLGSVNGVTVRRAQDKEQIYQTAKTADIFLTQLGGTPRAKGLGRALGKPVVQLIHNTNDYSIGFLGDGCDLAIYNSKWVSEFHKLHSSGPMIKFWSGQGGISYMRQRAVKDWPSIVVRPPVFQEYKELANPDGYITLINLVENKGPDVLYALAERHPRRQFLGVLGGYNQDKQIIRKSHNITIHPHTADIDEVYAKTKILIIPSVYESYGRVAAEAMSRGVPVIASDTPGLKECLNYNHLIRSRDDLPGWDQALSWIDDNYDFAQQLGLSRYNELYDQSRADMALFADTMEALANAHNNSRS